LTTAEVEYRPAQFLDRQGDDFVFMGLTSYDQATLDCARRHPRRPLRGARAVASQAEIDADKLARQPDLPAAMVPSGTR